MVLGAGANTSERSVRAVLETQLRVGGQHFAVLVEANDLVLGDGDVECCLVDDDAAVQRGDHFPGVIGADFDEDKRRLGEDFWILDVRRRLGRGQNANRDWSDARNRRDHQPEQLDVGNERTLADEELGRVDLSALILLHDILDSLLAVDVLVVELLSAEGHGEEAASTGQDAVEVVAQVGELSDLICVETRDNRRMA